MTSDQEFDAVEEFVRARTGVGTRRQITAATRLEDDLDLSGVEAEAFMEKFFDRFKVEVGDFSFDRYFVNEGSGLILSIVTRLSRKKRDALHRVPITVGMLAEAAAAGRWDSLALER
ncbi:MULTISPECIES: DUF1493 family protein [Burkholderiaceae]|uniref:DUF1493 family protein n=1 Tax=Burkholderiaceae TaxID=119060 RepID=UPI001C24B47C|nr:DUF1493 family protein [Burkholderia multivorans]MBU9210899.1 DUF1493 family protein [Burkholderia multivorans]